MESIEFWKAFWPSLASGVTTSILFTGLILWLYNKYRKPKVKIELRFAHHAPSSKEKTLLFYLINNGKMSFDVNAVHCFIYFDLMTFQAFNTKVKLPGVSSDSGAYHLLEVFNDKPCHPSSEIQLASITTMMADPFPHEWIDQSTMYANVFTSRGRWKPNFLSEARKNKLKHRGWVLGYKITSIVV
jgi:hypothetical protein